MRLSWYPERVDKEKRLKAKTVSFLGEVRNLPGSTKVHFYTIWSEHVCGHIKAW